jgi:hypothetical protein
VVVLVLLVGVSTGVALATMSGRPTADRRRTGDRDRSTCERAEHIGLDYSRRGYGELAWAD